MNIFARFYFRAARLEREKRKNKCSAKISTFTVFWMNRTFFVVLESSYYIFAWPLIHLHYCFRLRDRRKWRMWLILMIQNPAMKKNHQLIRSTRKPKNVKPNRGNLWVRSMFICNRIRLVTRGNLDFFFYKEWNNLIVEPVNPLKRRLFMFCLFWYFVLSLHF